MPLTRAAALCLLLCLACPLSARADGALAVGISPNLGENGVSWGSATNWANLDQARRYALQSCQNSAQSDEIKASCFVLTDVYHECIAFAAEPDGHNGGFGWGIGPNIQTAKYLAMEMCKSTAGAGSTCIDTTDGNLFNVCDRSGNDRQIKDGNVTGGKASGRRIKP
jgi:hypothetical protein